MEGFCHHYLLRNLTIGLDLRSSLCDEIPSCPAAAGHDANSDLPLLVRLQGCGYSPHQQISCRRARRGEFEPNRMELRNKIRYRLSADAVFAWEGAQHNRLQGKGITRDISLAGTFICTPTSPPVGTKVVLEIFLAPSSGTGKKVRIRTEAKVIRVEHSATPEGFAAISRDFKLQFSTNGQDQFSVSSAKPAIVEQKEEDPAAIQETNIYSLSKHIHGSHSRARG
jgi:PilZ domain